MNGTSFLEIVLGTFTLKPVVSHFRLSLFFQHGCNYFFNQLYLYQLGSDKYHQVSVRLGLYIHVMALCHKAGSEFIMCVPERKWGEKSNLKRKKGKEVGLHWEAEPSILALLSSCNTQQVSVMEVKPLAGSSSLTWELRVHLFR